ncbi:leucine-rich repeat domain-containing protein [Clostridium oryzae]|uniref:Leucine rich repeat protein n=1 Tax=Clostridium oryzae TaxID=1450648 RepID=A0A1V4IES3_9CLOT|nr:leucine-rich repeat domain-containing protein [Clostridium oryzae]OPJ58453.1 hypothetical protein CLORY_36030 [Clostridium oryzae]
MDYTLKYEYISGSYPTATIIGWEGSPVDVTTAFHTDYNGVLYTRSPNQLIRCPEGKNVTLFIPNTTTSISDYAFQACAKLTQITIPNSVTSIGLCAFEACYALTSITVEEPSNYSSIDANTFLNCPANLTVYYHQGAAGFNTPIWRHYNPTPLYSVTYNGNGNTDGTGQKYTANRSFPMGTDNITLYAQWAQTGQLRLLGNIIVEIY